MADTENPRTTTGAPRPLQAPSDGAETRRQPSGVSQNPETPTDGSDRQQGPRRYKPGELFDAVDRIEGDGPTPADIQLLRDGIKALGFAAMHERMSVAHAVSKDAEMHELAAKLARANARLADQDAIRCRAWGEGYAAGADLPVRRSIADRDLLLALLRSYGLGVSSEHSCGGDHEDHVALTAGEDGIDGDHPGLYCLFAFHDETGKFKYAGVWTP